MSRSPVRVPFARPSIDEEAIAAVVATLRSGWIATGPRVAEFEERFRALSGSPFAVATGSGTGALQIALTGLGVRGGEVVVPTMTFVATALAVVHSGARPAFADVEEATLNLDPADAARRVTSKTRAIVPVHYAGLAAEVDQLGELARAAGAWIVEDAAHALGCTSRGRHAGTIGDAGAFSFHASKNVTTIEGGMITTSRAELAEKARRLRLHGITRDAWDLHHDEKWHYDIVDAGFKCPMSDVQAALGLQQLQRFAARQERRAAIAHRYREGLADAPGVRPLADAPSGSAHGNHLFVIRVDPGAAGGRDRLAKFLREAGIETNVQYRPLHLHSYFQREYGYRAGDFPRAERAFREILSLPFHPGMTDDDVDLVVDRIREFAGP